MNWTDVSTQSCEVSLYVTPAGKDLNGDPLYTMQNFCMVRLNDNTDASPTFMLPLPWQHPLGDYTNNLIRFRIEQVSGAVPAPQPTDLDQRALHYVGPL
jgi:hypothetical protein